MTKPNFNVGDVVHLQAGSPPMTVIKYDGYGAGHPAPVFNDPVTCIWFDNNGVCHERTFPGAILR